MGFVIRIHVPEENNPDGIRLIKKDNWAGTGLIVPRNLLFNKAANREELESAGVYVLWGKDPGSDLPMAYIGQSEKTLGRLKDHDKDRAKDHANKDFWTYAAVFISGDRDLNTAHFQYLEARLYYMAKEYQRCHLDNINAPKAPKLSEDDEDKVKNFLKFMLICFPIMGVNFFEKEKYNQKLSLSTEVKGIKIKAEGYDTEKGFKVLKGALARKDAVPSLSERDPNLANMRKRLLNDNELFEETEENYRLRKENTFPSPTRAATVLAGKRMGAAAWKNKKGQTLTDIRNSSVPERKFA